MKKHRILWIIILFAFATVLFFSNDFGLIDVEKEAIITAVAIDNEDGKYSVTVQIAVPEATSTSAQNTKTQITGKGDTIGGAIKNTGDVSGWFPQLAFCNLIIIGNSLCSTDIIKVLDFFAKTLRVQDSAQIVLADNSARELLEKTTPLDNISSFAIQKILFKNPGFDTDVATNDIKTFCAGYYDLSGSSFMPIVKVLDFNAKQENSNGSSSQGQQGSNGQQSSSDGSSGGGSEDKGKNFFDASTTALFLKGIKVGELNEAQTHAFNFLWRNVKGTTLSVNYSGANEIERYLLKVLRCNTKTKLKADDKGIKMKVEVDIYCKIADHNSGDHNANLSNNKPLPNDLIEQTENILKNNFNDLFKVSKQTNCDFLQIRQRLYRFGHKYYERYQKDCLDLVKPEISVRISGQK
ncbi:MAG: hypothetical protein IKZ38_01260 [Clostridia bacterium]|nr:hypothetical protein [Clostridia bacterium]